MKYLIVLLLFLTYPIYAFSIENIDKKELECINNTSSTYEMLKCTDNAEKAWFKEINKYRKEIKKILPVNDYNLFIESEKQWDNYRQSHFKFISNSIDKKEGTMYRNVAKGIQNTLVKQHALFLKEYYQILID